ncbi:hypothetical protein AAVH_43302 [Aphelenchoides avenae]|nr:hypothetical protein AAVH_43302 [Aphelenchus avenae]
MQAEAYSMKAAVQAKLDEYKNEIKKRNRLKEKLAAKDAKLDALKRECEEGVKQLGVKTQQVSAKIAVENAKATKNKGGGEVNAKFIGGG